MIAAGTFEPDDSDQGLPDDQGLMQWDSAQEVVWAHQTYLKAIANMLLPRRVKVKHAPSDIVQDVAYTAIVNFSRFKGHTVQELQAWLEGILKNKCMQAYRSAWRAWPQPLPRVIPPGRSTCKTTMRLSRKSWRRSMSFATSCAWPL